MMQRLVVGILVILPDVTCDESKTYSVDGMYVLRASNLQHQRTSITMLRAAHPTGDHAACNAHSQFEGQSVHPKSRGGISLPFQMHTTQRRIHAYTQLYKHQPSVASR
jgi:hypothetical protein